MLIHSEVTAIKETNNGTEIIVKINERIKDTLIRYGEGGKILAELRVNDGRTITNEQRKKYFSTLKDIADYTGNALDYMHDYFKFIYCYLNRVDSISMSNCSVSEAREMINYIIEFAIQNHIPLTDLGINRTDDINRYLYVCLINRACCICGKKADIHHVTGSRVGMGFDRNKIDHLGREAIALCRIHHQEAHNSEVDFFDKHKVYGLKLDKFAIEKLGL